MKKAGVIFIAAAMVCGLAACGNSEEESGTTGSVTPAASYQDFAQGSGWDTDSDTEPDGGQDTDSEDDQDAGQGTDSDGGQNAASEDGQDAGQDADPEDNQEAGQDTDSEGGQNDKQDADAPTADDYAFSSNDWKTLEFALDGVVYTFPLTWSDIEAAGFLIDEDYRHEVLESNYYTLGVNAETEAGERISVRFKNFTEGDRELQDCDVYGIGFDLSEWRDVNPDVMLCNGVTFGMTAEEVKALMGEPDYYYESEGDDYTSIRMEYYATGHSYENEIEFNFWNGALTEIDILNKE
ncbi:MAG: MSCRAMM family adhesin SdrC [Lachnospiraceae bacterium]|nr:MSCRAMM family adhesin SdrC [Lachnospiraceae bacterium]